MDGPERHGLESGTSRDWDAWNPTQAPGCDTTPNVVHQELVLRPPPSAEPHHCEVGMVRRATVGELDGEAVPVRTPVEVDEHFAELRTHIAHWFGSCDLNQTQISGLRGNPIL
jgi:hypothetical protein